MVVLLFPVTIMTAVRDGEIIRLADFIADFCYEEEANDCWQIETVDATYRTPELFSIIYYDRDVQLQ